MPIDFKSCFTKPCQSDAAPGKTGSAGASAASGDEIVTIQARHAATTDIRITLHLIDYVFCIQRSALLASRLEPHRAAIELPLGRSSICRCVRAVAT